MPWVRGWKIDSYTFFAPTNFREFNISQPQSQNALIFPCLFFPLPYFATAEFKYNNVCKHLAQSQHFNNIRMTLVNRCSNVVDFRQLYDNLFKSSYFCTTNRSQGSLTFLKEETRLYLRIYEK